MNVILILALVVALGFVLFSLVRGLIYFAHTSNELANRPASGEGGPSDLHFAQNRMMFARVKWQAIAIVILVLIGMLASAR